ncbi:N-acetylmuramyl-L-alanine amidase, partial [Campylobacter troglodytis]
GLNYTQYNGKWEEAAQEQKVSIKHLVDILKAEYGLTDDDVYKHNDISPQKTGGEADGLYDKD